MQAFSFQSWLKKYMMVTYLHDKNYIFECVCMFMYISGSSSSP